MKKIPYILLALMLCLCLAGAASAFLIDKEAVITPSGVLGAGEEVTVDMVLSFAEGTMKMGNELVLETQLKNPVWETNVTDGGHRISSRVNTVRINSINGFLLEYPHKVYLEIKLTGTVPEDYVGREICVLSMEQEEYAPYEMGVYKVANQKVYNINDLASDISSNNAKIKELESELNTYSRYNLDGSQANGYLAAAKDNLKAAQNFGVNDFRNSITALTSAQNDIYSAQRVIAEQALALAKQNTDTVADVVAILNSKGMSSESLLLNAANQGTISSYNTAVNEFNNGNYANATAVFKDSVNVLNTARKYSQDSGFVPTQTQTPIQTQNPTQYPTQQPTQTPTYTQSHIKIPVISDLLAKCEKYHEEIILAEAAVIILLFIINIVNLIRLKRVRRKGKRGRKRDYDEL